MPRDRSTIRNILVLGGGYYLSTWVSAPFWWLMGPWINRASPPHWLATTVVLIPPVIGSAAAGFVVGLVLEARRPLGWALALGVIIAVLRWISVRWHMPPDLADRAEQALKALVPAAVAVAMTFVGYRYARNANDGSTAGA